ncbi:MAG: PQQ-binding-like beta-propeller repeat protein, partial [Verrucomicrobiota bacterium]|nr:PQQ-binding-like beta-propeller repeat protein [Verrucomicrobiota bacterium]
CFSSPALGWLDGKRVFYATTGDGSVVCANARTGEAIWQVPLFKAGINASVVVYKNDIAAAIYGTPYEPGQMVGLKIPHVQPKDANPVVIERKQVELWTKNISTSTSSPILVGETIYVVAEKGELHSVNIRTGKENWKIKLGIEQRNASPLYADGKIYLPMLENPAGEGGVEAGGTGLHGAFYVIQPGRDEAKVLSHAVLDGRCFATPSIYNGKLYVQTTKKLYCFGKAGKSRGLVKAPKAKRWPKPGKATRLQIVPSEILLAPGQAVSFRTRKLDANGFLVEEVDGSTLQWESYIPPTAKVRARMNATFNDRGQIVADKKMISSAGAFKATLGDLTGVIRGRVLPAPPLSEDFEDFKLNEDSLVDQGVKFAYPPLPWIGARFKFEVREKDGSKVLRKTIDNKRLQRATVFIGEQSMSNYTVQADVLTDGRRRKMSDVGIINQRYYIVLKGNEQKIEINSNLDRIRVPERGSPPNYRWKANTWHTLKSRIDVADDGSGVIRAKAWPRDEAEPEGWTVEY